MVPSVRSVLLGSTRTDWSHGFALAVGVFAVTFLAYAIEVFSVAGGVVFLPGQAAAVGVLVGAVLAYRGRGLVVAWMVAYAALLGYSADHSLLGLSGRSLAERVTAFLELDGLVYLAVAAVVLGTLAWIGGRLARRVAAVGRDLVAGTALE